MSGGANSLSNVDETRGQTSHHLPDPMFQQVGQDQHHFGGYQPPSGPGVLQGPQQAAVDQHQGSHWPQPFGLISTAAPNTVVDVPMMGGGHNDKLIYDHPQQQQQQQHVPLHHQQQPQHLLQGNDHGWYQHQSNQMINHGHFIHDHHQQPNSMMILGGYDHGNVIPMPPPQQQQQQSQMIQLQHDIPLAQAQVTLPGHVQQVQAAPEVRQVVKKQPLRQQQKPKRQEKEDPSQISVEDDDGSAEISDSDDLLEDSDEPDIDDDDNEEKVNFKSESSKGPNKRKVKKKLPIKDGSDLSKLDENAKEVAIRFKNGCECHDQNCFKGLDPEGVSRHRLNIAELSKLEHDMYLMGVTMACLENTEENNRQKERKRLRSKYRFMGREVCLGAFLYLDNTTLHQLKSIRKHVMSHGVTPRIHGNHRKKPHNTFSLDIYQYATRFLQAYFETHSAKDSSSRKKSFIYLSPGMTCKKIHSEYNSYCKTHVPDTKTMGYSTFRHFIKEQFPNLRFQNKDENPKVDLSETTTTPSGKLKPGKTKQPPVF